MTINVSPVTETTTLTAADHALEFRKNANSGKSVESVQEAHMDGQ